MNTHFTPLLQTFLHFSTTNTSWIDRDKQYISTFLDNFKNAAYHLILLSIKHTHFGSLKTGYVFKIVWMDTALCSHSFLWPLVSSRSDWTVALGAEALPSNSFWRASIDSWLSMSLLDTSSFEGFTTPGGSFTPLSFWCFAAVLPLRLFLYRIVICSFNVACSSKSFNHNNDPLSTKWGDNLFYLHHLLKEIFVCSYMATAAQTCCYVELEACRFDAILTQ